MIPAKGFTHVDWSYSAAQLYESCPRRFYYRYNPSTRVNAKKRDKPPSPPGAAIGSVVHDCIEAQIQRWRQGNRLSLQAAQNQATEQLRDYVSSNESHLESKYTGTDDEFDLDDYKRILIRTAHAHIERFFQIIWPQFSEHEYILHEATKSFTIADNTVWVRPDLCTRNKAGDFVVTDWKTTSPDPFGQTSMQLLTYALWSHREYEPDLNRILVQLVHTSDGSFDDARPDENSLNRLQSRIRADRRDWSSRFQKDDFPPNPAREKCMSCPAIGRCEAGQSVIKTE